MNELVHTNEQSDLQKAKEDIIQKIFALSSEELDELLEFIEGGALCERCTEKLVSGQNNA